MAFAKLASAALLLLLATLGAAEAAPSVRLSAQSGPPTLAVTVRGAGYTPFAAVDIFFDSHDLCLTNADDAGRARCTINVPPDAKSQRHWLSMRERTSGSGAQAAFVVETDMPQFRGRDSEHQGSNPFENVLNAANVGNLKVLWQTTFAEPLRGTAPVVAKGIVYAASTHTANATSKLFAFNAQTGQSIAGFPRQISLGMANGPPVVGNGKVYLAAENTVAAFDAATGQAVPGFPVTFTCELATIPTVALGNLYVGCGKELYALNADTGKLAWFLPAALDDYTSSQNSAVVISTNVYLAAGHRLYGFDALTGQKLPYYPRSILGNATTATVAYGNSIYAGSATPGLNLGYINGLDAKYGLRRAGFPQVANTYASFEPNFSIAEGKIYLGYDQGKLWSFNIKDGSARNGVPRRLSHEPMIANGVLYTEVSDGLAAVSLSTGKVLWSNSDYHVWGGPVVANGILYHTGYSGNLTAYSVNGMPPTALLPGGALGVKPALSALRPNYALKAAEFVAGAGR